MVPSGRGLTAAPRAAAAAAPARTVRSCFSRCFAGYRAKARSRAESAAVRRVAAAAAPKDVGVLKKLKESKGPSQQADPMYVASSEYLAQIGLLNLAEKSRVLDIATNPNSLFLGRAKNVRARPLDVDKDMRPVVDYLMSKGIKEGGIVQVVTGYPPVLCMNVEILEGFWTYLESIGVKDVSAVVVERPTLLGLDVDTSLRKIIDYLKYVDTPVETIIKYLERSL